MILLNCDNFRSNNILEIVKISGVDYSVGFEGIRRIPDYPCSVNERADLLFPRPVIYDIIDAADR
jgi:hypothetical protein